MLSGMISVICQVSTNITRDPPSLTQLMWVVMNGVGQTKSQCLVWYTMKKFMADPHASLIFESFEYTEYKIILGHPLPLFSLYSEMHDFESN